MSRTRPPAKSAIRPRAPLSAARSGRGALGGLLGFARQRPGVVLATFAAAVSAGVVSWNALHQANRHPAPLFGQKSAAQPAEPPRRPDILAEAPLPVPRPDLGSAAAAPGPAPTVPVETIAARGPGADPIGSLIRSGDAPAKAPDPQRVSAAQKALSKLGYGPLRPDGVMGATTRQAVERFERDQKLPVTGNLAGRTSRQLATLSGNPLD